MNFDELGFKGQRFNLSRQTDTHYALASFKLYLKEKFQKAKFEFEKLIRLRVAWVGVPRYDFKIRFSFNFSKIFGCPEF